MVQFAVKLVIKSHWSSTESFFISFSTDFTRDASDGATEVSMKKAETHDQLIKPFDSISSTEWRFSNSAWTCK